MKKSKLVAKNNRQRAAIKKVKFFLKSRGYKTAEVPYKTLIELFATELGLNIDKPWRQWLPSIFVSGDVPECMINTRRGIVPSAWGSICKEVYAKYENICGCCGSRDNLSIDHIKPVAFYPELSLDFDNLQILCRSCNSRKRTKVIDYRKV